MKTFLIVFIVIIISSCTDNLTGPESFQWINLDETETINESGNLSIEAVKNPMPSTVIQYSIPDSSNATLTISNSYNTVIATLVDGEVMSGVYNVQFDATSLRDGVYFYRLQIRAANYTEDIVKRMLLVK